MDDGSSRKDVVTSVRWYLDTNQTFMDYFSAARIKAETWNNV